MCPHKWGACGSSATHFCGNQYARAGLGTRMLLTWEGANIREGGQKCCSCVQAHLYYIYYHLNWYCFIFLFSSSLICSRTYRVQWTQLFMGLCPRTLEGVYKLPVRSVVIMNVVQRGQDILKWTWKLKVCRIMELMWLDFLTLHQQDLEVQHQWLMCSLYCYWIIIGFVHNIFLDITSRDCDFYKFYT